MMRCIDLAGFLIAFSALAGCATLSTRFSNRVLLGGDKLMDAPTAELPICALWRPGYGPIGPPAAAEAEPCAQSTVMRSTSFIVSSSGGGRRPPRFTHDWRSSHSLAGYRHKRQRQCPKIGQNRGCISRCNMAPMLSAR